MSHKIVSHRIFKNEYQKSFIMFLAGAFKSEETETILTLHGITEEVAHSIMSLMYKSESEFNTAYELALQKSKKAAEDNILHTVSGVYCDTIQEVFTAYTGMNTHL